MVNLHACPYCFFPFLSHRRSQMFDNQSGEKPNQSLDLPCVYGLRRRTASTRFICQVLRAPWATLLFPDLMQKWTICHSQSRTTSSSQIVKSKKIEHTSSITPFVSGCKAPFDMVSKVVLPVKRKKNTSTVTRFCLYCALCPDTVSSNSSEEE